MERREADDHRDGQAGEGHPCSLTRSHLAVRTGRYGFRVERYKAPDAATPIACVARDNTGDVISMRELRAGSAPYMSSTPSEAPVAVVRDNRCTSPHGDAVSQLSLSELG